MNFQKLIEEDCNRVNPIVQLAGFATRDHAQQGSIGVPLASNQMLPQSFNMNEIMAQMQEVESQNAAMQSSHGNAHTAAAHYGNQIMQPHQNPFLKRINIPQYGQNQMFGFPIAQQHFGRSLNFPLIPVHLPIDTEYYPNIFEELNAVPSQLQETPLDAKELEEDEQGIEESNSPILKAEDDVPKISYLHYGGLSVEDVNGSTDLGVEFTETENFYNFVENYVIKHNGQQYKKCRPRSIPTRYEFYAIVQDSSILTAKRVLCPNCGDNNGSFIMPFTKLSPKKNITKALCDALIKNEMYQDTIKVMEDRFSSFKQTDYLYIFQLADLYLHEHMFYQACQTLFAWFKNEPDYSDIVPPYFTMEHKDDGNIEKETLKELQKMFIKAAQRSPFIPDFRIQMALAKLCQADRDYDKSADCMLSVLANESFDQNDDRYSYLLKCLSDSLALSGKLDSALSVLHPIKIKEENVDNIDVLTKMGLICLQQKHYKSAITYFSDAVTKLLQHGYTESNDNLLVNSWTRLRLCTALMARNRRDKSSCEVVDQKI